MTRLFFLAACFAGALATYDYGGSDSKAADKSAGYAADGAAAEQKNSAMEMNMDNKMPAEKSGGETMNGGMDHTMDMKSNAAVVDLSITVISSYKGGNAPVEQIAQPSMNQGAIHKVTVGGDAGLVFSPDTLTAMPGDMVEFTFMSMNHTLTQSTFDKPCKKMDGGADSGFLANINNTMSPPPSYMFQVKDKKPIWFYCKQKTPASHCGKGMTFSINPTPEKSQAMFMAKAIEQNGTAPAATGMEMMMMSTSSSMPMPAGETSTAAIAPDTTSSMPAANIISTMEAATTSTPPPAEQPVASPPEAAIPAPSPAAQDMNAAPATPQNIEPAPATPQSLNAAGQPPAAQPANNMVAGTGSMQGGQCSCSCLCGTGAFPAGAGVGMYGGMSGAVAM
ncbi:MAG: hypothetical protein Q9186_007093 [Xanthomendoza sp. 1 TL-2023]